MNAIAAQPAVSCSRLLDSSSVNVDVIDLLLRRRARRRLEHPPAGDRDRLRGRAGSALVGSPRQDKGVNKG